MHKITAKLLVFCLFSTVLASAGELSGRRAPSFALPDASQKWYDIEDFRGKVLLLDIMLTNCPHCAAFSKVLEDVKAKYGNKIAILSVVNPPSTANDVNQFVKANNVTSPILMDCGQVSFSYLKPNPRNPAINVPHLFIIDGKGMIVDDYGYDALTKEIFEGKGLFPILDKILRK